MIERGIKNEASLGTVILKLRGRIQTLERGGGRGAMGVGRAGAHYVTHPELEAKNYASFTEVQEEIKAEILRAGLPSRLVPHLNDLEAAAFGAGGSFNLLLGRLKDLEERQVRKAVTIGRHTFRNFKAVKLWTDLIWDDELHRFAWDANGGHLCGHLP